MNRDDFIQLYHRVVGELKVMGLEGPITAVAGGAMLVEGLRATTDDLDLQVQKDLWVKLVQAGYPRVASPHGGEILTFSEKVDFHHSQEVGAAVTDGVRHQSLAQVLALKKRLNRAKDQADIAAIERRLAA